MDTLSLKPQSRPLRGTVQVPGDKSISHRAVMFGAIANGTTTIENFLTGDDCLSTISCFRRLGVHIEQHGTTVTVHGKGWDGLTEPKDILNVGNSGTTARLMLGILAGRPFHSVLIGDESIAKRPMSRVTKPLQLMGAIIDGRQNGEFTPLSVRGAQLNAIRYELPVASAQVKSAILLAGLQSEGTTEILEPAPSRDHTERMIRQFSGEIEKHGNVIRLNGKQTLKATNIVVPGDISSAAFFLVAGAIVPGSEIILPNVGLNPTRTGIIDVMKQMGADITIVDESYDSTEPVGTIIIRSSKLKGIEIGGEMIPRLIDELPIIALLATQAEGKTIIRNAEELKVKETNRIDAVCHELQQLGADIQPTEDGMIIHGKCTLTGGNVRSYGDHRIGMMLAIASLICQSEVTIDGVHAVSVSYPTFFEDLKILGMNKD
ncbi:MAG: 3-phosphoshikimate 1-carboxyvinyltransferase [Bacillus sp. (in: Bacteria)]|jgi:3-phosphoshikimate 1-carboxyvinyltransferase|nr:3-phosphoshikimate 1-carboxyvinyltransferase [Bacillus sp. (in: firmicutes)]